MAENRTAPRLDQAEIDAEARRCLARAYRRLFRLADLADAEAAGQAAAEAGELSTAPGCIDGGGPAETAEGLTP